MFIPNGHRPSNPADRSRLVSIQESCQRLGISAPTIYRMRARGELQMVRLGRRTLIRESDLLRLMGYPDRSGALDLAGRGDA